MKAINLVVCECGKYAEKNEWRPYKAIDELILKKIKEELPKAKADIKDIILPEQLKEKKDYVFIAKANDKEHKVNVSIKLSRCNICSREGTQYFEAIMQLRTANPQVLEEAFDYIQLRLSNLRSKGMFLNKLDRLEDGFDLSFTSRKLTQVLGKELQERFGGKVKVSPRLFTYNKQKSKNVYRINMLVVLPSFTRGDILLVDDKVCVVEKIGKKIKLIDLHSEGSLLMDFEKMDCEVMKKQQAYVSKTYPSLEVINPHDYQSSMVKNRPKKAFTNGQAVNVVIHKGIYVVD